MIAGANRFSGALKVTHPDRMTNTKQKETSPRARVHGRRSRNSRKEAYTVLTCACATRRTNKEEGKNKGKKHMCTYVHTKNNNITRARWHVARDSCGRGS